MRSHAQGARRPRQAGFSLMEVLVVVFIIILLVGILMPVLSEVRRMGRKALVASQLNAIGSACEAYYQVFRVYPGYYSEAVLSSNESRLTSTENLVLSLLGGGTTPPGFAEVDRIGGGPVVEGRQLDAFYVPKENELVAIRGTVGPDNDIPELVDLNRGLPILYYRGIHGRQRPVGRSYTTNFNDGPGSPERPAFIRGVNANYTEAHALRSRDGRIYNQRDNSLLSDYVAAPHDAANESWVDPGNNNFAALIAQRSIANLERAVIPSGPNAGQLTLGRNSVNGMFSYRYAQARGTTSGGFVLIAAGDDGIYYHKDQIDRYLPDSYEIQLRKDDPDTGRVDWSILDQFDDVIYVGGQPIN